MDGDELTARQNYTQIANDSQLSLQPFQNLHLDYTLLAISISILSFIGIIGNVPVLIVYFRRKDQKASNTFIKVLAFLDLFVCACVMPYTIVYEYHLVTSDVVCRSFELSRHFSVMASNVTLVAIATERYIAVCRIGTKINVKSLNKGVFGIFAISVVSALPSIGIFTVVKTRDVSEVPCLFPHEQTYGHFCHFTYTLIGSTLARLYQLLQMLLFFTTLIVIIVLYGIIYVVLWRKTKIRQQLTYRREHSMTMMERQPSLIEKEALISDISEKGASLQNSSIERDESSVACTTEAVPNITTTSDSSYSTCNTFGAQPCRCRHASLEKSLFSNTSGINSGVFGLENDIGNFVRSRHNSLDITSKKFSSIVTLKSDLRVTFQNNVEQVKTDVTVAVSADAVSNGAKSKTQQKKHKFSLSFRSSFSSTDKVRKKIYYHRRTAKMLFLCTVIYFVTWMPFWLDIFGLTNSLLLRYTFFIGNATNPIVYGIVNKQVRKQIKRLITDCFNRCFMRKTTGSSTWQESVSGTSANV